MPAEPPTEPPAQRRRWRHGASTPSPALLLVTLLWLIVTAPLGRALEPLDDPAMLLLSRRGPADRPARRDQGRAGRGRQARSADAGGVHRHRGPPLLPPLGDRSARDRPGDGRQCARPAGCARAAARSPSSWPRPASCRPTAALKRKAQEVIIAFWLEGWLTKDEILSRYLSSVYFGDGVYGLRAAVAPLFRPRAGESDAGPVGDAGRHGPGAVAAGADQQPRRARRSAAGWCSRRWPTPASSAAAGRARRRSARPVGAAVARSRPAPISPTGSRPARSQAFEADYGEVRVPTTLDADLQRLAVRAVASARDRRCPGGAGGDAARRPGGRDGRRPDYKRPVQPRHPGAAPAGLGVQAVRLSRRAARRLHARQHDRGRADHHRRLVAGQQRRRLSRPDHACARPSPGRAMPRRCACPKQVGRGNVHPRRARPRHHDSPLPDRPSLALGTSGVSLLELTAAYAAIAGGRYPVAPRGLPRRAAETRASPPSSARGGRLDARRDRAPMLDLLWAAANEGTGRRAALGVPTFGKTGTTQEQPRRLVHRLCRQSGGRRVGRPRRQQSLGKITGGTAPAQIWRSFMAPRDRASTAAAGRRCRASSASPSASPNRPEEPAARGLERGRQGAPRDRRAGRRADRRTVDPRQND